MHDSADHLRRLAHRLVDKVCLEHQPNMKRLAREPDDAKVFDAALKIINRVCDLLEPPGIPMDALERMLRDDSRHAFA